MKTAALAGSSETPWGCKKTSATLTALMATSSQKRVIVSVVARLRPGNTMTPTQKTTRHRVIARPRPSRLARGFEVKATITAVTTTARRKGASWLR